jgi:hypothetical protein
MSDRYATVMQEAIMAIEIEVAYNFGKSQVDGVLLATVIVRFDGPIETMHINVLIRDRHVPADNRAEAISMAKQLAVRLINAT